MTTHIARHPLVSGHPPRWASGWGEDRYGVFASFSVGRLEHRMRWIPPGSFVMGSPPDETERGPDEEPHEVIVPDGFWLGETVVTQELYRAVMKQGPSYFKGDRRPVEGVSWHDAQEFLVAVNRRMDALALRLPREAEWEYACRAGTTTPFSFGKTITPEQVNYDGNHPYGDAAKGLYRQTTVDVKSLPPNPWGLREMHGNVWEWCTEQGDWTVETGVTLSEGGPGRVLRGGSWFSDARFCRSAARGAFDPSFRSNFVGFRVARGQGLGSSPVQSSSGGSEGA